MGNWERWIVEHLESPSIKDTVLALCVKIPAELALSASFATVIGTILYVAALLLAWEPPNLAGWLALIGALTLLFYKTEVACRFSGSAD